MRKLYFFLAFGFFINAQSQTINIADANFKTDLLMSSGSNNVAKNATGNYIAIDANGDGEIQVSEAQAVYELKLTNNSSVTFLTIADITGIEYFTNLRVLDCWSHNFTNINVSGMANLQKLTIDGNNLTTLNVSNLVNLTDLECAGNELTSVNLSGATALQIVDFYNNHLTGIDLTGLGSITNLGLYGNDLSDLDLSPTPNLEQLYVDENNLTTLDVSMCPQLVILECSANNLSSLNITGLTQLAKLYCQNNNLSTLDLSDKPMLVYLLCHYNQITSLDLTGKPNLLQVYVYNNLLTTLEVPECQQYCEIDCYNNQLTYLNMKNGMGNATFSDFSGNPNLQYICADESELPAIATNIASYGYTNCHANSYCSFVPGGTYYIIEGTSRLDLDGNGCDASDNLMAGMKFKIQSGSVVGYTYSNSDGNYNLPVISGYYTVTPILENPSYFTVSPASANVSFPTAASPAERSFCIAPNGIHHDLEVTVLPLNVLRPGFDTTYKIVYKNKGNQLQSGTIGFSYDDATLDFVSSVPAPDAQTGGNVSWNFSNLAPFETRTAFVTVNANTPTEIPALTGGEVLAIGASASGLMPEETLADNTFALNQTVVNAWDPNDKTCLEGNTVSTDKIGDYVHYLVRFENTGTFAAQNIVVRDMIDTAKFDITTLVPTDGSHPFTMRISQTNLVEFIFENINLPFDDAHNDGYVAFKIKTKPTLIAGNSFANNAGIYFDYNFPVATNTATTVIQQLGTPDFDFLNAFTLYPNPVKKTLNIQSKNGVSIKTVSIYNLLGQLLETIINDQDHVAIDVSNLKSGHYIIKVDSDKGIAISKFIKE